MASSDVDQPAQEPALKKAKSSRPTRFCAVFAGSSDGKTAEFRDAASRLGRLLGERSIGLVYGGATGGLMGAVADAVVEQPGGYVVGVFPPGDLVPSEKRHRRLSEAIDTPSLAERKQLMLEKADVIVALPGGPGTLDELSEVIMHKRLKHHRKPIFALNTNDFWQPLVDLLRKMEEAGFTSEDSTATLVNIIDTPEEIVDHWKFLPTKATAT